MTFSLLLWKCPLVSGWTRVSLGTWSSPWRQGYVGWVWLLPGPPGTTTQGCVLGPHGARWTCLCGWRVVSGETCSMLCCSQDQSTPSLQLWVLRLRAPVQAVSTLCDAESTDRPSEERASNGPGSTPTPAPGTGHLGRRKHETSSQTSLHHSTFCRPGGGSQLRDASRTGKDQTDHLPLD